MHLSLHNLYRDPKLHFDDWRTPLHQLPSYCTSELHAIFKRIRLSIKNKPRIYIECSAFINSFGLETIIDTLINHAAINDPADLDVFCKYTGIQLSEDQMQEYKDHLRTLNVLESQLEKFAMADDVDSVKRYLEKGARVNSHNKAGITPLMKASKYLCLDR